MDLAVLHDYQARGLLKSQRHPRHPLTIWNYTPTCQYDKAWDDITMQCRGLVTDDDGKVWARPFRKFFNLQEHIDMGLSLPDGPFEAQEKLDGSLIIAFWYKRSPFIVASRGSFTSPQADEANSMFFTAHDGALVRLLEDDVTYLFEVIYPENRIVVDYGQRKELVLLAAIETATGQELPLPDIGYPTARRIEHDGGFRDLPQHPNEEGYVLRWPDGTRVKVKNDEYVRLHRILTGTNARTVWEAMRDGTIDSLLTNVPDEFHDWVRDTSTAIRDKADHILTRAHTALAHIDLTAPRKDIALAVQRSPKELWPVMFCLLDNKDPWRHLWSQVKPDAGEYPYRSVPEEEA